MGAPGSHARKPGTGQIRRARDKWMAIKPQIGPARKELRLGTYPNRREAERALDEWLAKEALAVAERKAS